MTGKHAGPRDWRSVPRPGRVPEDRLVAYFPPRPAPPLELSEPITVRQMHGFEEATSGLGDIVLGTGALAVLLVVGIVRGVARLVRAIRRWS